MISVSEFTKMLDGFGDASAALAKYSTKDDATEKVVKRAALIKEWQAARDELESALNGRGVR